MYTVPPILIPNPAHWNNFADAWTRLDFTRAAFNSIFLYAVPVTIFTLASSMLIAYGFSPAFAGAVAKCSFGSVLRR